MNFQESMDIHAMTWLYPATSILAKARNFQNLNRGNKSVFQHEESRNLPNSLIRFTDADFNYLEKYLCSETQAYFQTRELNYFIGADDHIENVDKFPLECEIFKTFED